ncbi:nucleotide exchange factor GrpE [Candidatus Woesebacteria bacterium RIFCSPHIGHO2_01_FULL_39_32]|uniref:Protein GrpE n=2 Tax=Candidatus Woeseibacteriota TaxID=1752722 RepID=A0A0G0SUV5_9BACT|nr:MAG: Protein GrpE [Candidatus Woesebacteria bacterium GW2011_GWA1_39_8]OGM04348.1 MAG: nucleotide exchange factor GrpE [Candidatus Woesebacteria bacterium GWB1_37_5]OGM24770.1 MAG: nucleotide exchange factor GrpE [Candidatus Woesebacteria bacterium RIFCSPHIGHO2_01_FULL_39_32]OGM37091.1 MAG: nucleotide exchange factor GrpE [Candidatus Woesebacteria bacterium RIFCSPHIGHO2_12_FULL_38_11]OGM64596.1 MAG: nucleotide exchange factor GrpE [Candidatus Woesebacteria bacterium RIFCSPLOWO2_01_FULL_39_25
MKRGKSQGATEVEVVELKIQLARALADYDNLRKRVEREKEEIIKAGSVVLFEKLLPILDMLARAQEHLKDEGLGQVIGQLNKVLEEEGIVKINTSVGDIFDAYIHEVLEIEKTSEKDKKGKIAEVLQDGWMVKDGPIVRAVKVKVYGGNPPANGDKKE